MIVPRVKLKKEKLVISSLFFFLLIILNDYLKTISMGLPIQTCGCSKLKMRAIVEATSYCIILTSSNRRPFLIFLPDIMKAVSISCIVLPPCPLSMPPWSDHPVNKLSYNQKQLIHKQFRYRNILPGQTVYTNIPIRHWKLLCNNFRAGITLT